MMCLVNILTILICLPKITVLPILFPTIVIYTVIYYHLYEDNIQLYMCILVISQDDLHNNILQYSNRIYAIGL